ncbi:MAG: hypothetical protein AB7O39_02815 [Flavobacteriaceae bacterium]
MRTAFRNLWPIAGGLAIVWLISELFPDGVPLQWQILGLACFVWLLYIRIQAQLENISIY